MSNNSESWHLDKRVPITLILAILLQSMGFVWAASQINFQVQDHERRITAAEMTDQRRERELYGFNDRLARLEEQSKAQLATLQRIEVLLRQQ